MPYRYGTPLLPEQVEQLRADWRRIQVGYCGTESDPLPYTPDPPLWWLLLLGHAK